MKKLLYIVPFAALLAAGCNSAGPSQSDNVNNQPQTTQSQNQSTPAVTVAPASGSTWNGTLKASDNSAQGNLMLVTASHTIYLNTSRDFSALIGKQVNVSYQGTLNNFTLQDITPAQ